MHKVDRRPTKAGSVAMAKALKPHSNFQIQQVLASIRRR
jgi:hypothetical protein